MNIFHAYSFFHTLDKFLKIDLQKQNYWVNELSVLLFMMDIDKMSSAGMSTTQNATSFIGTPGFQSFPFQHLLQLSTTKMTTEALFKFASSEC